MAKTAFQISSIPPIDHGRRRAFTLVEVLISTAIAGFVLLGVLTSFLMIGRTSANIQNYTAMETEARKGLEVFSRDARLAYAVTTGFSETSVVMSVPDATSSNRTTLDYTVTYTFNPSDGTTALPGTLVRRVVKNGTTTDETLITKGLYRISGVPLLNYYRFITAGGYSSGFTTNTVTTGNATEIKQIEVSFLLKLTNQTVTTASNKVFSARFTLRNK